MRFMLCTVFILAVLLVANARGQEYENSDEDNSGTNSERNDENSDDSGNIPWWTRLFNKIKTFFKDIMALFQEFKREFHEKTKGVVIWTEELWAGMKKEMNEWVDDYEYATDEEKDEMRVFIERLQMPKESEEDEY